MAWNLWFNTNTWIALLMKLKALALVALNNYITNYVTSILLMIFWYYLLGSVINLWKQTHLDRNVPVPLEQSLFYQLNTLITGQRSILTKKGAFFLKKALFWKKGSKHFTTPYWIPFLSVLHQNKVSHFRDLQVEIWINAVISTEWDTYLATS